MHYHPESEKIYKDLQENINELQGYILLSLGGIRINIRSKDGIGGLIEEWFGEWAKKRRYNILNPKETNNSQEFPDYYIGAERHMLEIKTFDSTASANFDIANFESYHETIQKTPKILDADYLIFSYESKDGVLKIKKIWLKKIWEITCSSERWPLKTQTKRDVIYNIRPATWYSENTRFPPFSSKEKFVEALNKTMEQYKTIK
jgi:type II restriction enzyme